MHTEPMSESEGQFGPDWVKCETPCRKCGKADVHYREWESSCGGYEDTKYECHACGDIYWIDGPDS